MKGLAGNSWAPVMTARRLRFFALGMLSAAMACGDGSSSITTGALSIAVLTTGSAPDPDGYDLSIGTHSTPVAIQDTVLLAGLPEGQFAVALGGFASNCLADAANPTNVQVQAERTTSVSLRVNCPDTTGRVRVLVVTEGIEQDTDGYEVRIGDMEPVPVLPVDTVVLTGIRPGHQAIRFQNVTGTCEIVSPTDVEVVAEAEVTASVTIHCGWLLVYTCCEPDLGLYRMSTDGQHVLPVLQSVAVDGLARFSRDGRRIVFASNTTGNLDVYAVNRDGSGLVPLARDPGVDWSPAWSPTGSQVMFATNRGGFEWPRLHIMNADGSGVVPLTSGDANEGFPTWSPDGSRILYDAIVDGYYTIWTMNPDGSGRLQLTTADHHSDVPAWSPDGAQIAFSAIRDTTYEVYVMNADGSGLTQVTDMPGGTDAWPAWSPSGEYIAFTRQPFAGGNPQGYLMKRDGSNVVRVAESLDYVRIMDWQPR